MTNQYYFQYKYSILTDNATKQVDWEKGVDRLADLELMPDMEDQEAALKGVQVLGNEDNSKKVAYHDVWEQYRMCFTVFHPEDDSKDLWSFESNKKLDVQIS